MAAVLEPMSPARASREGGFTVIELMVVVVVAAILMMVAVPSFTNFFANRRVEGVATELSTDLQFARSEAVSRQTPVRVTFVNDRCYVIHRETLAVDACVTTGNGLLKTVQIDASSTASLAAAPAFIAFEPVRGLAANSGTVTVGSSVGNARLAVSVSPVGRANLCVPSGYSLTGFKPC
jgi:prepilin-type N-terminal cleavage/methylation domain-containing protein